MHATPISRTARALPQEFTFQYLGLLVFMIGDGVEAGFLSPFIVSLGFTPHFSALMFTIYGLAAAAAAGLSGVLCDAIGSRKVILAGLFAWIVPHILFLSIALPRHSAPLLLTFYGLRGFGYPLVGYGILTLLMREIRPDRRGLGAGLFWFCFTAGLPTLGTVVSQICLPRLGEVGTLWIGFAAVLAGGLLALGPRLQPRRGPGLVTGLARALRGGGGTRGSAPIEIEAPRAAARLSLRQIAELACANPSLLLVAMVRAINSSATHGIIVFMPLYFTHEAGMARTQWLSFLEIVFLSNIIFNLVFGAVSDATSWIKTVVWVGGIGGAAASVLMYWAPLLYGRTDPFLVYAVGALFGLTLAGYVPLSAAAPSLLPEHEGIAMSFLNFGAGTSVWLGPAVVYLVEPGFGARGVLYAYAAMFLLSAGLAALLSPRMRSVQRSARALTVAASGEPP